MQFKNLSSLYKGGNLRIALKEHASQDRYSTCECDIETPDFISR